MIKLLKLLKYLYQRIRVDKRLYRYGTLGLGVFDDRSRAERLCDWIDGLFVAWEKKLSHRRSISHVFKSFFDISTQQWVNSWADIRRIEKETGLTYMDFSDIYKEAARNAKHNEAAQKKHTHDAMVRIYKQVQQGRSFVNETREKIRKGEYRVGQAPTMN